jgi:cytochrome c oxidase subunit 2
MREALIRLFPPQASHYAREVDVLFFALSGMAAVFVILICAFILVFAIRYRRALRPDPPPRLETHIPLEVVWIAVPLLINLGSFVWGAELYVKRFSGGPRDAYEILAVGKQWMWKFEHPSGRREVGELHVPLGRAVRITAVSQDVIHDLFFPSLRLKHDVLPVKYTKLWFEPSRPGHYHLFCAQYCGSKHSKMTGWLHVMESHDFTQWLTATRGQNSPAAEGAALLESLGCRSCHRRDSRQGAPRLEGIYGGPIELTDGSTVTADDDYLRRSILQPAVQVVAHYQPVMPTYQGRVTEEEIFQIIAYLKSTMRERIKENP